MRKPRDISEKDKSVFSEAVQSQKKSDLYKQLNKEKRLERFIDVLSLCGQRNLSMTETCKELSRYFPSYVRGKGLDPRTLRDMMALHSDIEEAWTFNRDLHDMRVYRNATRIATTTDLLSDIKLYNEIYDSKDSDLYTGNVEDKAGDNDGGVQVNIYTSDGDEDE